jgi:molybdate transport system regulatory protein
MHQAFRIEAELVIRKNGRLLVDGKRMELLRAIRLRGSILSAAKALGISYQMAWTQVREMNSVAPLPVVARQRGGATGGGAVLTEYGLQLVVRFLSARQKHEACLSALEEEMDICFSKPR